MPEILHRVVLGNTWPSRAANPSTHQRGTAHSPSHQGGGASQTRAVHHALQGDASSIREGRGRGANERARGEPIARRSGSEAVLTRVLPAPRRRSWETDATPSARNSGSIACQRFCIGCLGTVGGELDDESAGRLAAPRPQPGGTPAGRGRDSTVLCFPLLDWGSQRVRHRALQPGDKISLGSPDGKAHPPPSALVPQQQLLQPSPPR